MDQRQFDEYVMDEARRLGVSEDQVLKNLDSIIHGHGAIYRNEELASSSPSGLCCCNGAIYRTKVWATASTIRSDYADIPEHLLAEFAVNHPEHTRKCGPGRNSKLLFRTVAVLDYIENLKETK